MEGNSQEEREECLASLGTGGTRGTRGGGGVAWTRTQRSDERRRPQNPGTRPRWALLRGAARGNQLVRFSALETGQIPLLCFASLNRLQPAS